MRINKWSKMIQIDECCLIVCHLTGLGDDAFCLREAGLDDTFERQGTPADGQVNTPESAEEQFEYSQD